ncbi:amino acid adenylation domain-containing protein [Marinitoga hydrogenitolerans DSM 16785]|uniref:Amino acid adenylation domain-containing protein n=1 Tax=Marinitoga hydrogenitolerans (strain DSM 16785 / JCM 12826 / AT1271) TaxID=1122195 RepID=A0A1M4Y8Z8_MARH1|nr:non-ribosomal peptide synthetase [Marinitoga hydrogenitolerans]SHF02205.1 amino acid adenylation domain-containing protein [Marinitoga hydrogenitolerans DSM 16785]
MNQKHIIKEFKEQVSKNRKKTALITTEGVQYSYGETDLITDNLAGYFYSVGIKKGDIIPIIMKKDEFLLFTILALFKIGAAYVPISDNYPENKIKEIITQFSEKPVLINFEYKKYTSLFNNKIFNVKNGMIKKSHFDENIDIENYAYILFTSGSTGKPKGVIARHKNLSWIINELQLKFPVNIEDRYLFSTPFTFDVSLSELFGWVSGGGSIVIPCKRDQELFKELIDIIYEYKITHLALSPSILSMISENEKFSEKCKDLKYLMVAGEVFPVSLANKVRNILDNTQIFNLYGPTETTVYATMYEIKNNIKKTVPIGKALNGVKIKIKKEKGTEGKEGEILVGGNGVTDGYYNNKKLTEEMFVLINGEKYYKTGDYGYIKDNNIIFLGRKDSQIQINGIRVELEEIENRIYNNFPIKQLKIIYYKKKLICFYISNKEIEGNKIKNVLRKFLNKYMIPEFYIRIDKMPLNINKKIDMKSLIKMFEEYYTQTLRVKNNISDDYIKQKIKNIIKTTLSYEDNVSDNISFFMLPGSDSLSSLKLINNLEKVFDINLSDDFLYIYPDINSMTEYIEKNLNQIHYKPILKKLIISSEKTIEEWYKKINKKILSDKIFKKYETHYLQKVYYYDNFNSYIHVNINIPFIYELNKITKALNELINTHELLRSKIVEEDTLYFVEYNKGFDISEDVLIFENEPEERINEIIEKILIKNRLNHLLYMFYINYTENCIKLNMIFSHNIMDQKSVHVLKQSFFDILNDKYENKNKSYFSDFVKIIKEKNNNYKFLSDEHTKELFEVEKHGFVPYTDNDILIDTFKIKNKIENDEKIIFIIKRILSKISKIMNIESLIASTIMNYRIFNDKDFSKNIGDYHTSIVFRYSNNWTENVFEQKFLKLLKRYENGYQPQQFIFKNYPIMNEIQKKMEFAYDLNVLVSINYLGEIRQIEKEDLINKLKKTRNTLKSFPGKKIYITSFTEEDKCYVYYLTAPERLKEMS